ncbi:hypothetical protein PT974_04874 [Cladobotryum mycophilum]|uniref:Uncharacterized protein n=1 Tax=Cladobotryum mycophilum TaxID=491253 RepID=A0ABR0SRQ0_9HYPO
MALKKFLKIEQGQRKIDAYFTKLGTITSVEEGDSVEKRIAGHPRLTASSERESRGESSRSAAMRPVTPGHRTMADVNPQPCVAGPSAPRSLGERSPIVVAVSSYPTLGLSSQKTTRKRIRTTSAVNGTTFKKRKTTATDRASSQAVDGDDGDHGSDNRRQTKGRASTSEAHRAARPQATSSIAESQLPENSPTQLVDEFESESDDESPAKRAKGKAAAKKAAGSSSAGKGKKRAPRRG